MSTITTTTSWGSRVGSSFKGVLAGLILVVAAVCVLFWNEGRTIKRTKALAEAGKTAVSVDAETLDSANEDKLIHISGDVKTDDVLNDADFNITLNALQLKRIVEMYQWQEDSSSSTSRTSGGGEETTTTFSYSKVWSETLIDSSSFHDKGYDNPKAMPYETKLFLAQNANLGAFALSKDQVENLSPSLEYNANAVPTEAATTAAPTEGVPTETAPTEAAPAEAQPASQAPADESITIPAPQEQPAQDGAAYKKAHVNEEFAQDFSVSANTDSSSLNISANVGDDNLNISTNADPSTVSTTQQTTNSATTSNTKSLDPRLKPYGAGYYIGDPNNAQIGDVRITFTYVATPCPTSFVAQQHGNSLIAYQAKTGKVLLQAEGVQSLEEMIANAQNENKMIAWFIRVVGLFVIFFGFKAIFAPLDTLVDIIPFASTIVGFGTGLVAFCLTLFLGLGSIGVGWIYYRPLVGIPLVVIAVVALFYPMIRGKKKAKEA